MGERHTITETDLDEFIATVWVRYASSSGNGSQKLFYVGFGGLFRVTDHDREAYVGHDKTSAIIAYNEAQ